MGCAGKTPPRGSTRRPGGANLRYSGRVYFFAVLGQLLLNRPVAVRHCYILNPSDIQQPMSLQVLQDWDATMGGPIIPGFFVIITTLLVYYSALVASKLSAGSNGTAPD